MITSHVLLQNSTLALLSTASLRPRVSSLLRYSEDVRFILTLGFELRAFNNQQPVVGAPSGRHAGSIRSQFAEQSRVRFSTAVQSSMMGTAADGKDSKPEAIPKADPVVQYVVLRKDLVDTLKWPLGSVISQGCHAAVAAIILHKDDPSTAEYCGIENLNSMHTVTLEVKGETQLRNLAQKLEAAGVAHKLWIEQPENFPTCLATRPYRKSEVASFFKSLKLCR